MSHQFEAVIEAIEAQLAERGDPSLAVAVARGDEILWEQGFGWADRAARVPAEEHTSYSLASISKPVTATALMLLVERGEVDLDAPINDYLGDAKLVARVGDEREATVRRVANHTAGLPLHAHFFYADEPYERPHMDVSIARYGSLVTAPGERYHYSNFGYGVLDYLVERVSGRSFAEFCRTEIFQPLGLNRSAVNVEPELRPYAATRYGGDGVAYPDYDFDHRGASAVFASAHDLLRFGMVHLGNGQADQKDILSAETRAEMMVPTTPLAPGADPTRRGGYGIGWSANPDQCGYETRGHTGGMAGVATTLSMIPSEGLVVVALANASSALPFLATGEIYATLLPDFAEKWSVMKDVMMQGLTGEGGGGVPPGAGPDFAGVWEGSVDTYAGSRSIRLEFAECGDIRVDFAGQPRTLLNLQTADGDSLLGVMQGHIGTDDADRRFHQIGLDLVRRGDRLTGAAVSMTAPTPLALSEGGAPGRRGGNALPHWVELERPPA